jgi:hypothetical protein
MIQASKQGRGSMPKDPDSLLKKMKSFFEDHPQAIVATKSLSSRSVIEIVVGGESFHFMKEKKKARLERGAPPRPDVVFELNDSTMYELLDLPYETAISEYGIWIFKRLIHEDPSKKIEISLGVSPLVLARKGYFQVLAKGGKAFALELGQRGLHALPDIKRAVERLYSK